MGSASAVPDALPVVSFSVSPELADSAETRGGGNLETSIVLSAQSALTNSSKAEPGEKLSLILRRLQREQGGDVVIAPPARKPQFRSHANLEQLHFDSRTQGEPAVRQVLVEGSVHPPEAGTGFRKRLDDRRVQESIAQRRR